MPAKGLRNIPDVSTIYPYVYFEGPSNFVLALHNAVPTGGSSGTLVGVAGKGSLLVDVTNAKLYINTGSLSSPTWTVVGTQT